MSLCVSGDYKPILCKAFVDSGFDHRCSEDGTHYDSGAFPVANPPIPDVPLSSRLKSFFCSPCEGDEDQQIIEVAKKCQQAERRLSQQTYIGFLAKDPNISNFEPEMLYLDPRLEPLEEMPEGSMELANIAVSQEIYFSVEHDFFKLVGDLYWECEEHSSLREHNPFPFPSELLRPIHAINSPQKDFFSQPGNENADLTRLKYLGFHEFSKLSPNDDQVIERQRSFIEKTREESVLVKHTCRIFRQALDKIPPSAFLDPGKFKLEFGECEWALRAFKNQWKSYVSSHPILINLQNLYCQRDYFETYHQLVQLNRHIHFIPTQIAYANPTQPGIERINDQKTEKVILIKDRIEKERLTCSKNLSEDLQEFIPVADRSSHP